MNLISYYCTARLYNATSTTAVFYGIFAITLILLKYKSYKRRLYDILRLISKVHISSCCITVESLLYFLQRLQKLMEVIYRILNGVYPSYLNDIITVEELQHLRCQARLLVPRFSTIRYGKKSLSYLWNTLDNDIKQSNVLTAFKKR